MFGELIVSLLFLTSTLDGFHAIDESGQPLPQAELTFWRLGTTALQGIYQDQELATEQDNPITSDGEGRFPLIYLQARDYRVLLKTAQGVLRWDVDYICDCTDPPYVFRSPIHQAVDDGRPVPGAELTFSITETETPTNTYADPQKQVPLPNPLKADAGGYFPPVYLDDATEYRVRLADRAGVELLDVDPYVCACGYLLLTSKMYAVEFFDNATGIGGGINRGVYDHIFQSEAIGVGGNILSGTMNVPIVTYDNWPPDEAIGAGGSIISGTMIAPLVFYTDWPPDEAIGAGGNINSGTMTT